MCKVQHTSASLMINENYDSDVQKDMEMGLNKIVPETFPYIHTAEGADDMVSECISNHFMFYLTVIFIAWTFKIWNCGCILEYSNHQWQT